jgi:hypothetical protein
VRRGLGLLLMTVLACAAPAATAFAQGDVTFFIGGAFPAYDQNLAFRPPVPSLPGADITVTGSPEIRANGGLVFGGALAFELGVLGIEGRLDSTEIAFDLTGARYDLRATSPPFEGISGTITVGNGQFDADRLTILSLNARLRTPGPVGLVASGGLSYMPGITITGAIPITIQLSGAPPIGADPRLRLRVAAGEADSRFGLNGGAGLRIGGSRVALMAEVRAFYFTGLELRFGVDDVPDLIDDLVERLAPIEFEPVIVNAQAGLVFKF